MGEANYVLFLGLEWLDFPGLRLSFQLARLNSKGLNFPRQHTPGGWQNANVRPVTLKFAEFLLILLLLISEDGLVILLILRGKLLVGGPPLFWRKLAGFFGCLLPFGTELFEFGLLFIG